MRVAFLTAPSSPPAERILELVEVSPDQNPDAFIAHIPTAKALFALVEKLETIGCPVRPAHRAPTDPLLVLWLRDAHENPEPLASMADLFLLGGGWELLGRVLGELEASQALARMERLERLASLPGVYAPALFGVEYREDGTIASVAPQSGVPFPVGLAGGAPFEGDPLSQSLGHPRPGLSRLLGEPAGPEEVSATVKEGERFHLRFAVGLSGGEPEAVAAWVKRLRHLLVARWKDERRLPPISVSLVCFVPRPWTALQWIPMLAEEALKERLLAIQRELSKVPGLTVTHDLPKWALLEGILARGDRRAGDLLLAAARVGWDRARVVHPLNPAFVLHRERAHDEILPWDHLHWGLDRSSLWSEFTSNVLLSGSSLSPLEGEGWGEGGEGEGP
jgi:hypothetical protein